GVGGLGAVGLAGVLHPAQMGAVLGVVGVQLDSPAGVLQGVDLAAQALVGQAGQVIPAGIALPLGVQDAAGLGVAPVDDEIAGGLHLGGVGARGAGPLLAVPAVVEAPEPARKS